MRRAALAPLLLVAACGGGPVTVTLPSPGQGAGEVCTTLVAALPADLTSELPRLPTSPSSPYVRAWGSAKSPVVLTCGVLPPTKLLDLSQTTVNGLAWGSPYGRTDVYRTRDRSVVVEVSVPQGVLPFDVLAGVSDQILQQDPVDPVAAASAAPSPSPAPAG